MRTKWEIFKPKFKDIWQVDVTYTDSQGHEQTGDRPCLIIKEFENSDLVLVIPFTGEEAALHLPYTVKIEKNDVNGLTHDSVALVFQMKSISKSRFKYKRGRILKSKYTSIEVHIKDIFRLK
ncbi:MAG: type II toxin-antitoxin system PemK/MazF family toxin [Candidatus Thorarchaeota archaeon]